MVCKIYILHLFKAIPLFYFTNLMTNPLIKGYSFDYPFFITAPQQITRAFG